MIQDVKRPIMFGLPDLLPQSPFQSCRELYRLTGGNSGNLAFKSAIRRQLLGWGNPIGLGWNAAPAEFGMVGDVCVIPAANQLGEHADMGSVAERLEALDIPVVAISLGAQSNIDYRLPKLRAGTLRWVRAIIDRAPSRYENLTVRGEFTRRVLSANGFDGVRVLGCPSLFLNPSTNLGRQIERNLTDPPDHIAVAAGHPNWRHLARVEQSLTRMVTETNGAYVCQAPLAMVAMARGEIGALRPTDVDRCRKFVDSDMSPQEFLIWFRRHAVVFFDVAAWMEFLRRFDFVIGTRIHGVMLGIQSGVPGLCIALDSRTRELCETMEIPYLFAADCYGGLERDKLAGIFRDRFDASRFDAVRRHLASSYCSFLYANGLTVKPELTRLSTGAAS